jgi:carotenoid cleavage dioxygenase-like enzyme
MEDGDVRTLGPIDYEKRLTHPFTAHPKIDPVTGIKIISTIEAKSIVQLELLVPEYHIHESSASFARRMQALLDQLVTHNLLTAY